MIFNLSATVSFLEERDMVAFGIMVSCLSELIVLKFALYDCVFGLERNVKGRSPALYTLLLSPFSFTERSDIKLNFLSNEFLPNQISSYRSELCCREASNSPHINKMTFGLLSIREPNSYKFTDEKSYIKTFDVLEVQMLMRLNAPFEICKSYRLLTGFLFFDAVLLLLFLGFVFILEYERFLVDGFLFVYDRFDERFDVFLDGFE